MKVFLVNPARYMKDSYIFPTIHLLYIAQAIRRSGHEAEVVDIPYLINTNSEKFNIQDDWIKYPNVYEVLWHMK